MQIVFTNSKYGKPALTYRYYRVEWQCERHLSLNNYGQQVFAVNATAHVQFKDTKNLYLLLGSYGFLHFRYNYKLGPVLRWEAFTQMQQNAITKIQSRFLLGTSPRFKIAGTKKFHLYAASLAMYEIEKETGKTGHINEWRSSSYVTLTFLPNDRTELTNTNLLSACFF